MQIMINLFDAYDGGNRMFQQFIVNLAVKHKGLIIAKMAQAAIDWYFHENDKWARHIVSQWFPANWQTIRVEKALNEFLDALGVLAAELKALQ